ncbi:TIR domain-containing protein [Cellvibrio fontiphilus]|uniref:TIR domain-containing protein n=1 Tax=Cellvibrio fontiphilus TaxID=1815559 RepID=A0ABV7FL68_9GAMM
MNIFISWSGSRSKAVAEVISDWIKCVLQASQPWISTRDIDSGAVWFSEINEKLKDTTMGIVCLTQDNKNKPWILFETGALAKGLTTNRVFTFLIDLEPADLRDPLAQFNHTTLEKTSVWKLVKTINSCFPQNALEERILEQVFTTYWEQLYSKINSAIESNPATEEVQPRSEHDLLSEILNNTRGLSRRVSELESLLESKSSLGGHTSLDHLSTKKRIIESMQNGASIQEIVSNLKDMGFPEKTSKEIIKKVMNESLIGYSYADGILGLSDYDRKLKNNAELGKL